METISCTGGAGADILEGGDGDDTLYGGDAGAGIEDQSPDTLRGGNGFDTYYVGTGDTISDTDGKGRIYFRNNLITGGHLVATNADGTKTYKDSSGTVELVYNTEAQTLVITQANQSFTITDFEPKDGVVQGAMTALSITLNEVPSGSNILIPVSNEGFLADGRRWTEYYSYNSAGQARAYGYRIFDGNTRVYAKEWFLNSDSSLEESERGQLGTGSVVDFYKTTKVDGSYTSTSVVGPVSIQERLLSDGTWSKTTRNNSTNAVIFEQRQYNGNTEYTATTATTRESTFTYDDYVKTIVGLGIATVTTSTWTNGQRTITDNKSSVFEIANLPGKSQQIPVAFNTWLANRIKFPESLHASDFVVTREIGRLTFTGIDGTVISISGSESGLQSALFAFPGSGDVLDYTHTTELGVLSRITGTAGNDVLTINGSVRSLVNALAGDDLITSNLVDGNEIDGGTGNDIFIAAGLNYESYDGGEGFDTLDLSLLTVGAGKDFNDVKAIYNFEAILGSNHADYLRASYGITHLEGRGGNDTLISRDEGAHFLDGGAGDDVIRVMEGSGIKSVIGGTGYDDLRIGQEFNGDFMDYWQTSATMSFGDSSIYTSQNRVDFSGIEKLTLNGEADSIELDLTATPGLDSISLGGGNNTFHARNGTLALVTSTFGTDHFIFENANVGAVRGGFGADSYSVLWSSQIVVDDFYNKNVAGAPTPTQSEGDTLVLADALSLADITHEILADGSVVLRVLSTGAKVQVMQHAGTADIELVQVPLLGAQPLAWGEFLAQTAAYVGPSSELLGASIFAPEHLVSLRYAGTPGVSTGNTIADRFADAANSPNLPSSWMGVLGLGSGNPNGLSILSVMPNSVKHA